MCVDYAKTWNTQHDASKFEVLICTDHMLPDLAVSMAQNIVHYSIPSSWSAFSYRFSSMFDYFEDLVVNQVRTQQLIVCSSVIYPFIEFNALSRIASATRRFPSSCSTSTTTPSCRVSSSSWSSMASSPSHQPYSDSSNASTSKTNSCAIDNWSHSARSCYCWVNACRRAVRCGTHSPKPIAPRRRFRAAAWSSW